LSQAAAPQTPHARRLVEAVAIGAGRGEYLTIAGSPALTGMRARNDALFGAARTVRQPVRCRRAGSCPAALRLRGRPGRRGPGEACGSGAFVVLPLIFGRRAVGMFSFQLYRLCGSRVL
jgi:hypothetical protein